jgi:alkylhydroperoxidase/carboxymuconolactone decarboxylase family protein YurZ
MDEMLEPQDVGQLLAPEELAVLRRNFSGSLLYREACRRTAGPYPPAVGPLKSLLGLFYEREALLEPRQREQILSALLAMQGTSGEVAIHAYWGLMEGVTPEQLAATFLLVGVYAGVPRYRSAIQTLCLVCQTLKRLAAHDETADTRSVLREFGERGLLPR